jgi:DNA-binding CsgD family transcriptional regulator
VLDERLSAISVSQIATEANLSVETVTNLLAGVRDEVVDLVVVKN